MKHTILSAASTALVINLSVGMTAAGGPLPGSQVATPAEEQSVSSAVWLADGRRLELQWSTPRECVQLPVEGAGAVIQDCALTVGEPFTATFTARTEPATDIVGIAVEGDLADLAWRKLDTLGRELDLPTLGQGSVSGRLRLVPASGEVTPPGEERILRLSAFLADDPTRLQSEIRLRVLPAPELTSPGRIEGYLFEDQNRDGHWDERTEPGLPQWPVTLAAGSDGETVTTDAAGRFRFDVPGPGRFLVSAAAPGDWEPTLPANMPVVVPASGCPQRTCAQPRFGYARRSSGPGVPRAAVTLTTERGCLEGGHGAVYQVGEVPALFARASGLERPTFRLQAQPPEGPRLTLVDQYAATAGQWYRLDGASGTAEGTYRYELAVYDGPIGPVPEATAFCSIRTRWRGQPAIDIAPEAVDFGIAATLATVRREITVSNHGATDLAVRSLSMEGGSGSAFHFGTPGRSRIDGFSLAAGQSRAVAIFATPRQDGTFADRLRIESNDPEQPALAVSLAVHTCCLRAATIRTGRGCLETGEGPSYFVGEMIPLVYRVDTEGQLDVFATISERVLTTGQGRNLLGPKRVPINANQRLEAGPVELPLGLRQLTIEATANVGTTVMRVRETCTYAVAAPATRLAGLVFEDRNGDGVCQTEEETLADWPVMLNGPEQLEEQTDSQGSFSFTVHTPGTYTVSLAERERWRPTVSRWQQIVVGGGPNEALAPIGFAVKRLQRSATASQPSAALALLPVELALRWNGEAGQPGRGTGEVFALTLVDWPTRGSDTADSRIWLSRPRAAGGVPSGTVQRHEQGYEIVPAVLRGADFGQTAVYDEAATCPVPRTINLGMLVWEDDSAQNIAQVRQAVEATLAGQVTTTPMPDALQATIERLASQVDDPLGQFAGAITLPDVCGQPSAGWPAATETLVLELSSLITEERWNEARDESGQRRFRGDYGIPRPETIGTLTLELAYGPLGNLRGEFTPQVLTADPELSYLDIEQADEGRLSAILGLAGPLPAEPQGTWWLYLDTDGDLTTGASAPLQDGADHRLAVGIQHPAGDLGRAHALAGHLLLGLGLHHIVVSHGRGRDGRGGRGTRRPRGRRCTWAGRERGRGRRLRRGRGRGRVGGKHLRRPDDDARGRGGGLLAGPGDQAGQLHRAVHHPLREAATDLGESPAQRQEQHAQQGIQQCLLAAQARDARPRPHARPQFVLNVSSTPVHPTTPSSPGLSRPDQTLRVWETRRVYVVSVS